MAAVRPAQPVPTMITFSIGDEDILALICNLQ